MRWALEGLVFVLLLSAITLWQTRSHPTGEAPAFTLRTLDGRVVSRESLSGKRSLVVFWAPWCGVCRLESPNVSRVQSLVGERAHVLSVASEYPDLASVKRYVADREVDYPVLLGGAETARAFGVSAYPTAFVLDEEGQIDHSVVGYTTTFGLLWRLLL